MDYKRTNAPVILLPVTWWPGYVRIWVTFMDPVYCYHWQTRQQISVEMKNDLSKKLQEFASYNDNLERSLWEIESRSRSHVITKSFQKPTLIAAQEYEEARFISVILLKKKRNTVVFHWGLYKGLYHRLHRSHSILIHGVVSLETVINLSNLWYIWCTSHYISPVMLNAVRIW